MFPIVCPLELNTGQIQEGVGEAINGIVKHFHKPEKEVKTNKQWKGEMWMKSAHIDDLSSFFPCREEASRCFCVESMV